MQIYILVMQCCVLGYLYSMGIIIGRDFLPDYLKIFPAVIIGTFVGVYFYSRIDETMFRHMVLLILILGAVSHIIRGLAHFVAASQGFL